MTSLAQTRAILSDLIAFPTVSSESNLELITYAADLLSSAGATLSLSRDESGTKANLFATLGPAGEGGVILSGHTHDALPEPVVVGDTIIIASGSNGKFVSRVDLDVRDGRMMGFRHKLIPIFSDVIAPDPQMTSLIQEQRAPYKADLEEVIGQTDSLLYRRGNFNGTWDDLICDALLSEREADIAMSPGVRWGPSLLPGQDITREDIWNVTSMSYPNAYRNEMTGEFLKVVLEDVADNLFNPNPYYQQGGDMVRVGGLGDRIDVSKPQGSRITEMTLLKTGEMIDPAKTYQIAGWASVNEGTEGPPIWDVVESHIRKLGTVSLDPNNSVTVDGA